MAKKGGQEVISHKSIIVDNLGQHFNNPDLSDVTLIVGEQEFAAHRFALATQSQVFMTMLMGEAWRESEERKITLQESPQGVSAFSDFLKFFYTGTLTLTIDNVCGIHMLADKYDVLVLKSDCVGFMKDVLTGIHGDALKAGLEWLQYAESFLPDVLSLCYSAIRTNFAKILYTQYASGLASVTSDQMKTILSATEVKEELVTVSEKGLFVLAMHASESGLRCSPEELMTHVRFYNLSVLDLQSLEQKAVNTLQCNRQRVNEAFRVHAERSDIASRACKRRRLSSSFIEVTCSCNPSNRSTGRCLHINPRLYLNSPFGRSWLNPEVTIRIEPVDLLNLTGFCQKLLYPNDTNDNKSWLVVANTMYSEDPICEKFKVKPRRCHVGKSFTFAIACVKVHVHERGIQSGTSVEYVIKHTGIVSETNGDIDTVTVTSPLRFQGSWKNVKSSQTHAYSHGYMMTILLHK